MDQDFGSEPTKIMLLVKVIFWAFSTFSIILRLFNSVLMFLSYLSVRADIDTSQDASWKRHSSTREGLPELRNTRANCQADVLS